MTSPAFCTDSAGAFCLPYIVDRRRTDHQQSTDDCGCTDCLSIKKQPPEPDLRIGSDRRGQRRRDRRDCVQSPRQEHIGQTELHHAEQQHEEPDMQ